MNVSRMLWSVESPMPQLVRSWISSTAVGSMPKNGASLRVAGQGISHESDAQTPRMLLLAWGRVKRGDHDDIS